MSSDRERHRRRAPASPGTQKPPVASSDCRFVLSSRPDTTIDFRYLLKTIVSDREPTVAVRELPVGLDRRSGDCSVSKVLRFEQEIPDEGLILEVGVVLGGAPVLTFLCLHVGTVLRGAGQPDVVGHDDRPPV